MLAVVGAEGSHLDAGSVGLAIADKWSEAGGRVLFVDADASGSRLAERCGAARRVKYSPAGRGLPSLIVARQPLTPRLLADHCYSINESGGSLWALFAPLHAAGAAYAAGWLGERCDEVVAIDAERHVMLSSSLDAADVLGPLLQASQVVVVLAPVESAEQAKELWTRCRAAGLSGFNRKQRLLVVEGECPLDDEEILAESGLRVAGRLPVVDDERVLRPQSGRRERDFAPALAEIAGRLGALLSVCALEDGPGSVNGTTGSSNGSVPESTRTRLLVKGVRSVPKALAGSVRGDSKRSRK